MKVRITLSKKDRGVKGRAGADLRTIMDQLPEAMELTAALSWCRRANAGIRFESDGTVSAWANGVRRRRPALLGAISALRAALAPKDRNP